MSCRKSRSPWPTWQFRGYALAEEKETAVADDSTEAKKSSVMTVLSQGRDHEKVTDETDLSWLNVIRMPKLDKVPTKKQRTGCQC